MFDASEREMTSDETRMTNEKRLRPPFVIRHSDFVIASPLVDPPQTPVLS